MRNIRNWLFGKTFEDKSEEERVGFQKSELIGTPRDHQDVNLDKFYELNIKEYCVNHGIELYLYGGKSKVFYLTSGKTVKLDLFENSCPEFTLLCNVGEETSSETRRFAQSTRDTIEYDTVITYAGEYPDFSGVLQERSFLYNRGRFTGFSGQRYARGFADTHLQESYNQPLGDKVIDRFQPIIRFARYLTGREILLK